MSLFEFKKCSVIFKLNFSFQNNNYKYEMGIMKERMKQQEYQIDNYKKMQKDLQIKIDENEIMKEQLQQQSESR